MSVIFRQGSRIAWREPLRARARIAFAELRRSWHLPVGAGVSLALVGIVLLAIWARSLNEPFNLRAAALMCAMGLVVIFLLTLNDFIPRTIVLGEEAIRIAQPDRPQTIRYLDLRECELTLEPDRRFRGFGTAPEPLFSVLWDPDVDPESLRVFLQARGITLNAGPPSARQ